MALTTEQMVGAWLLFAGGVVSASFVLIVGFAAWTYTEGRRAERGCSRGGRVCSRGGKGLPPRSLDDASRAFLLGEITIDEMQRFYDRRRS